MFGFLRLRRLRLEDALAAHAAGEDRTAELLSAPASELEAALAAMLDVAGGEACERLTRLAVDAGVASRWRAQAASPDPAARRQAFSRLLRLAPALSDSALMCALMDESEAVQLEAACGLLRGGGSAADAEAVFALALAQPAETRVRLAGELKPRAGELAEHALPEAMASAEPARVAAVLDFVLAWERVLPLPALPPLLAHPDPAVRAAAVNALAFDEDLAEPEPLLRAALGDPAAAVRAAACGAVARLCPDRLLAELAARLEDRDPEVVRSAARALASAGPAGLDLIEDKLRQAWSEPLAMAALDAVERVKTDDYGYARL